MENNNLERNELEILSYEIGVMMCRAITNETEDSSDYDVSGNFENMIGVINKLVALDKNNLFCGFKSELENIYKDDIPCGTEDLFNEAISSYNVNFELKAVLVKVNEKWRKLTTTTKVIEDIRNELNGTCTINKEYLILLDDGETIDLGIIDDIKVD